MIQAKQIAEAIKEGYSRGKAIGSVGGCGRAYVKISDPRTVEDLLAGVKVDKKAFNAQIKEFAKGCELAGMSYLKEAYGVGKHVLYIGYDNATGLEWNRGEEIAKALRAIGLNVYVDGQGD